MTWYFCDIRPRCLNGFKKIWEYVFLRKVFVDNAMQKFSWVCILWGWCKLKYATCLPLKIVNQKQIAKFPWLTFNRLALRARFRCLGIYFPSVRQLAREAKIVKLKPTAEKKIEKLFTISAKPAILETQFINRSWTTFRDSGLGDVACKACYRCINRPAFLNVRETSRLNRSHANGSEAAKPCKCTFSFTLLLCKSISSKGYILQSWNDEREGNFEIRNNSDEEPFIESCHVKLFIAAWVLTRVASMNFQGVRSLKRSTTLKVWSINLPNNAYAFTTFL